MAVWANAEADVNGIVVEGYVIGSFFVAGDFVSDFVFGVAVELGFKKVFHVPPFITGAFEDEGGRKGLFIAPTASGGAADVNVFHTFTLLMNSH